MKKHVDAFNEVLADVLERLLPGVELGDVALIIITAIVATILAAAAFFIIKGLSAWIQRRYGGYPGRVSPKRLQPPKDRSMAVLRLT